MQLRGISASSTRAAKRRALGAALLLTLLRCGNASDAPSAPDMRDAGGPSGANGAGANGAGGGGAGGSGAGGGGAGGETSGSGGGNAATGGAGGGGGARGGSGATDGGGGANGSGGTPRADAGARDGGSVERDAGSGSTSKLPVPSNAGNEPRPSKSVTAWNLKVLDWAGFKGAASYTFDDSQPSQIDHWSELRSTGIPVTFYVTTVNKSYAGYDVTWKEAVSRGDELGNHTVNHCYFDLTGCAAHLATIDAEVDQCSDYLKTQLMAADVFTMAYPYGDTKYKALAQAKFFLARGTGDGMVGPLDASDPFNLPVKAAVGGESAAVFNGVLDSARSQGRWAIFLFHSLLPGANWYAGVDAANVIASIDHGKSAGDLWMGTVADVGAYWLGQKLVQAKAASASAGPTTLTWSLPAHFPPGRFVRVRVDGGTLTQGTKELVWNGHGYYEVALDQGTLSWAP